MNLATGVLMILGGISQFFHNIAIHTVILGVYCILFGLGTSYASTITPSAHTTNSSTHRYRRPRSVPPYPPTPSHTLLPPSEPPQQCPNLTSSNHHRISNPPHHRQIRLLHVQLHRPRRVLHLRRVRHRWGEMVQHHAWDHCGGDRDRVLRAGVRAEH